MSGEHTHPDMADEHVSLRADLLACAARLLTLEAEVARLGAVTEGLSQMATWHDYSGKPDGALTVRAGDYVRLDVDVADPPRTGAAELHLVYANCALTWASGATAGVIRLKYVREDGDETGFADWTVVRGATLGSPASFLITHTHFEVGQAGLGGRWWIRCGGGLAALTVGTRYVKAMQIG